MVFKTSVLWLALLMTPLLVGTRGSADPHHTHGGDEPVTADFGHEMHGHKHDKWEAPPAAYARKRSTRWADAAAIARGEKLFETYCQVCHGAAGTGTGPAAASLPHPPADLTNHFHGQPGDGDAYLFWRVSEGGRVEPFKSMQSAMPAFKMVLSEDQRWDVLAYVHVYFHLGLAKWHPEKNGARLVAGEQVGATRATALVPESSLGGGGEREEGGWEVGPVFEFPIPLFDQGQARLGRAMAELRRAQQEYYALGVRVRSTVRTVHERLQGAQDRALYYRDILLPLRERIVNETQLQYNAMQLGVFDLLRAREQQIQAAIAYVETLRDYWLARTDFGQLLRGRLPSPNGVARERQDRPKNRRENAGH